LIPVILLRNLILAGGFVKVVRFLFVKTATFANHTSHKLSSWYLWWWTSNSQGYNLSSSMCFDSDMGGES